MATSLMIYSGGYRDSEGLRDSGTWHFKTICMATYLKKEYNQSYTPSHTTPSQPFQLLNLMDESMTLRAPLTPQKPCQQPLHPELVRRVARRLKTARYITLTD